MIIRLLYILLANLNVFDYVLTTHSLTTRKVRSEEGHKKFPLFVLVIRWEGHKKSIFYLGAETAKTVILTVHSITGLSCSYFAFLLDGKS
jgi:hypothetical protein